MKQQIQKGSKPARFAAGLLSYLAPIASLIFFFTGRHTLFQCFGAAVCLFEVLIIIVTLILAEGWMRKLNPLFQMLPWALLGCLLSHWNVLDGIILGASLMVFLGAYMHTIDSLSGGVPEEEEASDADE